MDDTMIPQRFAPYLFGLILSGLMSFIVSGIATLRAVGIAPDLLDLWITAWLRCIHPPGGAMALVMASHGLQGQDAGTGLAAVGWNVLASLQRVSVGFGLAALVLGGAAAVATKKGFWAVLGGFFAAGWKFIIAGAVALFAGIGKIFSRKKTVE